MRHHGRKGARTDGKLFTMWLSIDERADLEIRASANDISAAEYVRRALAAVASVGGADEYLSRAASKRGRDQRDSQTKGKKK